MEIFVIRKLCYNKKKKKIIIIIIIIIKRSIDSQTKEGAPQFTMGQSNSIYFQPQFCLFDTLVVFVCLFFFFFFNIGWVGLDLKPTRTQGRPEYQTRTRPKHLFNPPKTLQVGSGQSSGPSWSGLCLALLVLRMALHSLKFSVAFNKNKFERIYIPYNSNTFFFFLIICNALLDKKGIKGIICLTKSHQGRGQVIQ